MHQDRPTPPAPAHPGPGIVATSMRIDTESDVAAVCRVVRALAEHMAFSRSAAYSLATAASELATNLLIHAGGGQLQVAPLPGMRAGIELLAEDHGPGIDDLRLALTDGYSTAGGLGCGLPGVERLMDLCDIDSVPGHGTRVRAVKWR
ncbi:MULTISPECIES: anti-sigma regulatory factor [Marichromatium]|uniref:Serine/threonine-protein kinase RsbT n=1 Tax=Marichromatium gracile TaxID=1048 RepID=A0A4R4AKH2_MARGR|nr:MULTISPECIES: anti-sigma regulatory factor [Marichromatium]TCW39634.1 serine/threonine-protein kinase RsbT [Marichromatium gracile]